MTTYIGVDDTDSPDGMCTTYLLTEIIRELDFPVLFGYPRLVRLNPNIPWKTRGNGALSIALAGNRGSAFKIGEIDGREVLSSYQPSGHEENADEVLTKVSSVIERLAQFGEDNTNPGLAISHNRPDSGFYWDAVRGIVNRDQAKSVLSRAGGTARTWKNGRGLIGATASISWVPRERSFEVIAYRERERWGTTRRLDVSDVSGLSSRFPTTFSNYDESNRHTCIVPSSPCPVLFGIRGWDSSVLEEAMLSVRSEPRDRWLVFETNQGTDDHITVPQGRLELFHSYMLNGTVSSAPVTIRGGHVFFDLEINQDRLAIAAFEETKELRKVVTRLIPGDRVTVWGGLKPGPFGRCLNLEKLAVNALAALRVKKANPRCDVCGKPMQSAGKDSGYRCRKCHTKSGSAVYVSVERQIQEGLYGVAASSRRHLSRPPEWSFSTSPGHPTELTNAG